MKLDKEWFNKKVEFTKEYTEEEIDTIARFLGDDKHQQDMIASWIRWEMNKLKTKRYDTAMTLIR